MIRDGKETFDGHQELVLCFGNDNSLLATRRMLLAAAGYDVICNPINGSRGQQAIQTASIAVLCHSLDEGQCNTIICGLYRINPQLRFVLLTKQEGQPDPCDDGQRVQRVATAPETLLAVLQHLVSSSRQGTRPAREVGFSRRAEIRERDHSHPGTVPEISEL